MSFFCPDDNPFDNIGEFIFGGSDIIKDIKNKKIYSIINSLLNIKK